jgi:molybdenum cofactor biosynthesis enzyme
MEWNHFDENGNAVMVDVSEKEITERIATASGKIRVNDAVMSAIVNHTAKKGDGCKSGRDYGNKADVSSDPALSSTLFEQMYR